MEPRLGTSVLIHLHIRNCGIAQWNTPHTLQMATGKCAAMWPPHVNNSSIGTCTALL